MGLFSFDQSGVFEVAGIFGTLRTDAADVFLALTCPVEILDSMRAEDVCLKLGILGSTPFQWQLSKPVQCVRWL